MNPTAAWREELQTEGGVMGRLHGTEGMLHFGRPDDEYCALVATCGLVDLSDWTQIEIGGKDRATFLHNLCSNEIRKLAVGSGCEAFFLNAKGHTLGHGFLFAGDSFHLLFGAPGPAEKLIAHLERYVIREDVQLQDRTSAGSQLLMAGPNSRAWLARMLGVEPPGPVLAGFDSRLEGRPVQVRRVEITGPEGFLIGCSIEDRPLVWRAILTRGARPCGLEALEMARIEYGFPLYGRDITEQNLPQEVDRDQRAISFVKGCYIGQETVARIDALGHVNRRLVGLKFSGLSPPEAGTRLTAGGQAVGEVTSAAMSPCLAAPLALAYLRRGHDEPGMEVESPRGAARVVKLPVR
jgi:folate-binding protein YgfZ